MEYQYKTDVSASVTWLVTGLDPDYLLLANKTHPLGSTYAPEETVTLTCPTYGGKEVELERRTAEALYAMLSEMAADGVTDVPLQMAAVAVVSAPLFLVFVFLRKYIMKGVSRSGIKG